jgi:hypothetical protein
MDAALSDVPSPRRATNALSPWVPWLFAETELAAKVEGWLDRGAGHRAGKATFQPLNAQLWEMNPVCYLKELSHSLLSGNRSAAGP